LKNIPQHVLRPGVTFAFPRATTLAVRYTYTRGAYLDENRFPQRDASVVDLRLARALQRVIVRLDVLNLTNTRYEPVGYTLQDFAGRIVPYYFPAHGAAARLAVDLKFTPAPSRTK
jgi:outer membrane receptor protein involved in Fe transport